jgi:hypothetical protein
MDPNGGRAVRTSEQAVGVTRDTQSSSCRRLKFTCFRCNDGGARRRSAHKANCDLAAGRRGIVCGLEITFLLPNGGAFQNIAAPLWQNQ